MRKIVKYVAVACCVVLAMASCSRKSEQQGTEEEVYGVSAADSLSILENTDKIMAMLQEDDVDGAAAKLYTLNMADTTVAPLNEEMVAQLRNRNRIFPVKKFEINDADLREPLYNAVVYDVAFADPDPETGKAPMTKMAFNIINLDGKFYVTIMEKNTLPHD